MTRPSISVVIPMFNEQENIAHAIARATTALEAHASDHEIIVVDDLPFGPHDIARGIRAMELLVKA